LKFGQILTNNADVSKIFADFEIFFIFLETTYQRLHAKFQASSTNIYPWNQRTEKSPWTI